MDKRLIKMSQQQRTACDLLSDLVKDEEEAPDKYKELLAALNDYGTGQEHVQVIRDIIAQENEHRMHLLGISENIRCEVWNIKKPEYTSKFDETDRKWKAKKTR